MACHPPSTASSRERCEAYQQSLSSEPILILTALLAVYIVLGILYESLVHPLTIISTLPSASVGAMLALMLFHMDLNVMSIIGIVLLIGIVKKNAIMMIDFALAAEREEGKSTEEAIFEACMLRFRPIMMTTMAAMFGALPLAFGTGMGSELRRPLGITIVGGLMLSQLITLYTTPVVYLALDRLRLRISASATRPSDRTGDRRSDSVNKLIRERRTMTIVSPRRVPILLTRCRAASLLARRVLVGPKYHPPVTRRLGGELQGISREFPRRRRVEGRQPAGRNASRQMVGDLQRS